MRTIFAQSLHAAMAADASIRLLLADTGYGVVDRIRIDYPARVIDFGAAEQAMLGAACGLSLSGFHPICYTISPFLLFRPFEWIRNFMGGDKIPVKLVGCGRDTDYKSLGSTHWACDDVAVLSAIGIQVYRPSTDSFAQDWNSFINLDAPAYLNVSR